MSAQESSALPDSEDFRALWRTLSDTQKQYVLNRQHTTSKKEATKGIGIHPRSIYGWDDTVEECVEMLRDHIFTAVIEEIQALSLKAIFRLREMLNDDEVQPGVQIKVVREVLNRTLGDGAMIPTKETEDHNILIRFNSKPDERDETRLDEEG